MAFTSSQEPLPISANTKSNVSTVTPTPTDDITLGQYPGDYGRRMGFGFDTYDPTNTTLFWDHIARYALTQIFGEPPYEFSAPYYDWDSNPEKKENPPGTEYKMAVYWNDDNVATIPEMIANNPDIQIMVCNEPDRNGQCSLTAAKYAELYHTIYTAVKAASPDTPVIAGGIVMPSKLRLAYLDEVLRIYTEQYGVQMPVDAWNTHNYLLPENCNTGAGAPPGMEEQNKTIGIPCMSLAEYENVATFSAQIIAFREWMKLNGYQDTPLIVGEYGVIIPYFTAAENEKFLSKTTDFLLQARSLSLGNPSDSDLLVQRAYWFSLSSGASALFDKKTAVVNPLGEYFNLYRQSILAALATPTATVTPTFTITSTPVPGETQVPTATWEATPTIVPTSTPSSDKAVFLPLIER